MKIPNHKFQIPNKFQISNSKTRFGYWNLIIIWCLVLGIWNFTFCYAETIDKIVAVVNDQTITASELEDAMKPVAQQITRSYNGKDLEQKLSQARRDVIERIIEEKLILQEAKSRKIEVKSEEIEEMLGAIRSKFPNETAFLDAIKAQGLSLWQLKKIYKEQIMVKKMVRQYVRAKANITPKQILDYYQSNVGQYKSSPGVDISQILIRPKAREYMSRAQKTAAQVTQLLNMGADFSTVAKKYSEGPNAQDGGNMGFVERGAMAKEIDDVIFNMKEGQISQPIKTSVGFAIVRVNSIKEAQHKPLEDVKEDIELRLLDETAKTALHSWIAELKSKAFIQVKE